MVVALSNNWEIHYDDIGRHKSGLTISRTNKDGVYELHLWNVSEWESSLRNSNYLSSEIGTIKLGLINQYIQIMNEKDKTPNAYIIPNRIAINHQIKQDRDYEARLHIKSKHKLYGEINPIILDEFITPQR